MSAKSEKLEAPKFKELSKPQAHGLSFSSVVLAGGRGTRMKSPLPKVLHPVAGLPMISRVVSCLKEAGSREIRVVVGYGENMVREVVEPMGATCHRQVRQLGTADAVKSAEIESLEGLVLICNGDHPLMKPDDLAQLLLKFREHHLDLAVATTELRNPADFGRIVRQGGKLRCIVEAKEASPQTLALREVNTGVYVVRAEVLRDLLPKIKNENSKGEFYLTDIVDLCLRAGCKVDGILVHPRVGFGVNDQVELALATRKLYRRRIRQLLDEGVIVIDPERTYVEDTVKVCEAVVLYPNVHLRGQTLVEAYAVVDSNSIVINSTISQGAHVRPFSHLESAWVGPRAEVGPFARLREGSHIGEAARVGNFVEIKKTRLGARSKANHHTYLGDAEVGEDTNIGCGTITCNYAVDHKKYKTKIGRGVFVGSDSQFIAPVEVGDFAVVASGSTITKNVPPRALAVARGRQIMKENYTKATEQGDSESSDEPGREGAQ